MNKPAKRVLHYEEDIKVRVEVKDPKAKKGPTCVVYNGVFNLIEQLGGGGETPASYTE